LNRLADEAKLETPGAGSAQARAEFAEGAGLVKEIGQVLGLLFVPEAPGPGGDDNRTAALIQLIVGLRSRLRAQAKAAAADNPLRQLLVDQATWVRQELEKLGVKVEDRDKGGGTTWRLA